MKANSRKRLFLSLVLVGLLLTAVAMAFSWYLIRSDAPVGRWVGITLVVFGVGFLVYALAGLASLTISLLTGHNIAFLSKAREQVAFAFLPVALRVGGWLGLDKDKIRASFIEVNNQLVNQRQVHTTPDQLLILAPVCLQEASCVRKVTHDIENCRQCGRCPVGDLLRISKHYGVHLALATGGTKARQLLKELRPQVVIAIACERDLVSGLQDARSIVVKGIANQRPNGPCFNTLVDIEEVENTLQDFLTPEHI